ncbi:uncharacterized protein LOC143331991 isoform X1 [Chaetodon auriga]|uniref:uncharacterized protein LOC143331991 isoform X1 n=1 Tax=Chaetodon auriga TaxID=39042 RepID=UPI004032D398
MSSNWRDDEIRELLSVRADADIVRQIKGTARDSVVYDQITSRLRDRGVNRAKAQVNNKLKALKRQYHDIVNDNGRSVNDRKTWCYFSLCEAVWGVSPTANPVALVGSVETASTSSFPEAPYSDSEEQTTVYETDVSINDSVLSTESLYRSPPKKRRGRNQTHSERPSPEMRDLYNEMDKNFKEEKAHITCPSPSTSPCTSARKKRRTINEAILSRLAHLDEEIQKFRQRDNADFRFAAVIVDMLAHVEPKHKSEVKFKIYQMLFEAGRDFPKQS